MPIFAEILQQGSSQAWLYLPSAVLLGALHGLEPGHSKTMMAAFIVAIRGTVKQAIMLGLAATVSHTAVVWLVAMAGMYFGKNMDIATTEPYFQLASAAIIIGIALWMLWRTWRGEQAWRFEEGNEHDHSHGHGHHDETHRIDTGHGHIELTIFEEGIPPHWRVKTLSGHSWHAGEVSVQTTRTDGKIQSFKFVDRDGYLESVDDIPEPHEFTARLSLGHAGHSHDYDIAFREHEDHQHAELEALELSLDGYQDAHERAHANDIRKRFANRKVTNGQILLFGLTGGLIPCPAAITVLLLCLQVKEFTLGAVLVLCFSVGLAITLVTVGAAAAIGARQASNRWPWFGTVARRAPYFSSVLIIGVGIYVGIHGLMGLST